jgi:hypothetical protein
VCVMPVVVSSALCALVCLLDVSAPEQSAMSNQGSNLE